MNPENYQCPKCGGRNFTRYEFPHPTIQHWYLNPGVAFNELVFGYCMPKTTLVCQDCECELYKRSYIPCPSCKTLHPSHVKRRNVYGNWRGVRCPSCDEAIPHIRNLFTQLILLVTFPLWVLPYYLVWKKKPLRPLYELVDGKTPQVEEIQKKSWRSWVFSGAFFGFFMWLFTSWVFSLQEESLSFIQVAKQQWMLWLLGGFAFGFLLWYFSSLKVKRDHLGKKKYTPSPYLCGLGLLVYFSGALWWGSTIQVQKDEQRFQDKMNDLLANPNDPLS